VRDSKAIVRQSNARRSGKSPGNEKRGGRTATATTRELPLFARRRMPDAELRRIRQPRSTLVPQIVELPAEAEQKGEVTKSSFITLAGVAGIVIILLIRPERDESSTAGESDA
jgi:hypothetical protein